MITVNILVYIILDFSVHSILIHFKYVYTYTLMYTFILINVFIIYFFVKMGWYYILFRLTVTHL